ncbi:citrate lyase subunit beta/citryl-CoA lyase [Sphingobium wenxiniae]|uniref:Citryl-CoA lyase n=2 Tax=Sphingobium TaxID=165695 RepID=T0HVM8_9SPHN|nr:MULTISPECIES: aldolase/citrate lyase family protein [Sphingobium]EQB03320.1 citryl-CoA lyase [Sphingobium baderi LL03]KMS62560.1 citryl-CoA lyase [Sphingobium baderi LL03]MBB6190628.1 citrate lyase subunit beta/citryl-CoA lyase [Sphingobium wenxiniae]TWH94406.1 citrate lyase subunit beta/citryl-CoA lyase [Sphingobium wenxiniae]
MLLRHARSLLFLPASNARAIAKVRTLPCDLVILDLEDAVPDERKEDARTGALEALAEGFGNRLTALRINVEGTPWHGVEMIAAKQSAADYVVLPKVESPKQVKDVFSVTQKPVIAMIESARGVLAAPEIAAGEGAAALFMGTNDLRQDIGIPAIAGRDGLAMALQAVILAARAAGIAVFDGVFNRLDDEAGFEAECVAGHALGFDGKTLIHPSQVPVANQVFGPDAQALADARRLIEAATGGAERFEGRMIESMHVEAAKALVARAEAVGQG